MANNQKSIVGILLIFLFIIGDIITGVASTHVPTHVEQGHVEVTVTASSTGSKTVTYAKPFASVPVPQFTNCLSGSQCILANFFTVSTKVGGPTVCFVCVESTGITWTSMPAATTEIFGDIHHEVQVNFNGHGGTGADPITGTLSVDCITPSTSTTAFLQIQYSTDGVSWNPLTSTLVVGVAPCGSGVSSEILSISFTFNTAALGLVWLRVAGGNGGGIGDNPVFNMIQFQSVYTLNSVGLVYYTAATVNGFTCNVNMPAPIAGSQTFSFGWRAVL